MSWHNCRCSECGFLFKLKTCIVVEARYQLFVLEMGGAELLRGLVQKAFDLEGLRRQFLRTHHVQLCLVERSLADTDVTIGVPHMGSMTSRGREPVFVSILRQWVPLAVLGTVLCALVGAAVQPVLRGLANDPQIEMAEDAAAALERGQVPQTLLPAA